MAGKVVFCWLFVACIMLLPTHIVGTSEAALLHPEARKSFQALRRFKEEVDRNFTLPVDLKDIIKWILTPDYIEAIENAEGVSEECRSDFLTYIDGKSKGEEYADRMYYSNGERNFIKSLYRFNFVALGNYELCTSVKEKSPYAPFETKQCALAYWGFIVPIKNAVCVPASCSTTDLWLITNSVIQENPIPDLGLKYSLYYECIDVVPWSAGAIVSMCIISIFAALVIAGTVYETVHSYLEKHQPRKTTQSKYIIQPVTNHAYSNDADVSKGKEASEMKEDYKHGADVSKAKEALEMKEDYKHGSESSSGVDTDSPTPSTEGKTNNATVGLHIENVPSKDAWKQTSCEAFFQKFLMSFSATTNGSKVLNARNAGGQLGCLNGIRVLSMWWVILGHTLLFLLWQADDYVQVEKIGTRFSFLVIGNATFSVDTFFVLSGLLVTYLTLKQLKKTNGRMNWALFYFHRFWRLTPLYMIAIAVQANLFVYVGKGLSMIGFADYMHDVCQKHWWTNLLYINNLYPFPGNLGDQCLSWSWYLANDMQFFLISPLLIILLRKSWKAGFAAISALCLLSFATTASIATYWGLPVEGGWDQQKYNNRTELTDYPDGDRIYGKPYCRIPAYLVGVAVGYILYSIDKKQLKIPKAFVLLGWCSAIATGLAVIYGLWDTYQGEQMAQGVAVFYTTVSRFAWSLAVAWVAFACITGYGGFANTLLSWSVWSPLGRLSYGAYLFHPMVIYGLVLTWKTEFHLTIPTYSTLFIACLVLSYVVAFVMSVLVEGPFMALEKLMLGKTKRE